MPIEATVVNTITCSIEGCKTSRIIGGNTSSAKDALIQEGWILEETILGREFDLCSNHAKEIQDFLGIDPHDS